MRFGHTKVPSLFIKEALGTISMILSILTLEGKLQEIIPSSCMIDLLLPAKLSSVVSYC